MPVEEHSWCSEQVIAALSREPVGTELAQQVAQALKSGRYIMNGHRDYCGVGLVYTTPQKVFEFCYVNDGFNTDSIISFSDENEFIKFLSEQSDYSMSGADESSAVFYEKNTFGRNNQRITVARLEHLVATSRL
ncbi:hypothetical protein C9374_012064 [Naegleria lovaniensis]|uniref:Uncharacterized protein n=1 Tax=Naegleria lovaniensis TaxID=51637 RepID=A0AA88GE01_NAELO|nr:uncharacterized protein C9374_013134 [Naegleria lovaniensis]XP_044542631.1 uncharacterized protein C9374_012064 [Naegleria lovaniensis]KAG2372854.1 hypothetical protein C9374_013134 [Naegleria lovaniensis]KAG2373457.1 hypothetical protein C9374_012064 [Naegleria lovaniensis]